MPGEDGYSLLRRLRTLPVMQGGHTPAIALTAYARQEDKQKARDAGFQHHLTKPVDASELIATVTALSGSLQRT
jgi:CheY-like chemotaxis protein